MRDLESWIEQLIRDNQMYKFYKSRSWIELKNSVMEEQHYECYYCKQKGKITKAYLVHHIYHVRDYPQYALSKYVIDENGEKHINLVCVCHSCHENICHPNRFKDSRDKQNEDRTKEINKKYPERW